MFAHVDLAQSSIWNSILLQLVTAFLSQLGVDAIGLVLTQAGTRAAAAHAPLTMRSSLIFSPHSSSLYLPYCNTRNTLDHIRLTPQYKSDQVVTTELH